LNRYEDWSQKYLHRSRNAKWVVNLCKPAKVL
jgi:hypothetical protein